MNDLLEQLRDANPVDRATLEVPPSVLHDAAMRPPRRRTPVAIVALACVGVALVIVLVTALPRSAPADLASRAYAAVTGPGIAHWRTELFVTDSHGQRRVSEVQEGWSAGGVQHILDYRRPNGHQRLETDTVIARGRMSDYNVVARSLRKGTAPTLATSDGVVFGDPMRAFRLAKRAGALVPAGPNSYRIDQARLRNGTARQTITYVLDPRTALPRALIYRWAAYTALGGFRHPAGSAVLRFSTYERLPDSGVNRAKLRMLAHPAISTADPARFYGLLRHGRTLTERQRRWADAVARGNDDMHLDASRARAGRSGVVVIPGRGAICIQIRGAGGCGSLHIALREGMGMGGSGINGQWVLVPDGISTVRARLPRHRWQRFPVVDNVVHLPNGGYHATFTLPPRVAKSAP